MPSAVTAKPLRGTKSFNYLFGLQLQFYFALFADNRKLTNFMSPIIIMPALQLFSTQQQAFSDTYCVGFLFYISTLSLRLIFLVSLARTEALVPWRAIFICSRSWGRSPRYKNLSVIRNQGKMHLPWRSKPNVGTALPQHTVHLQKRRTSPLRHQPLDSLYSGQTEAGTSRESSVCTALGMDCRALKVLQLVTGAASGGLCSAVQVSKAG